MIKKLILAGLLGSLIAFSLNAQTIPDATVDQDGNLVLGDGTVIPPPEGTVNQDGALVLPGQDPIPAPVATLNQDGSLTLGDGTTLEVPDLPKGGAFIVSWLGSDLFDYNDSLAPDQNQNYFSFTFKNIRHFAADNWFWFYELKAALYLNPNSGNKSLDEGIWVYTNNLFPGQTEGSWIFLARKYQWNDLRDSDGDGVNDLSDGEAGAQVLDGNLFIKNPSGYDTKGQGWFFFSEYDDGNYIRRIGAENAWVKLSDPVE